ncbi:MAG: gfo/Idh/MocA family oxidoreductase [Candidatus Abyssobacteria bacterium SURF_5]|uniref:Gfo/Idh/MocA family oxidoreductase n=1 Tax=Abyssobacteria bacterium (strain SURF_5) TaxID=2093360 RepID=A0A3A4N3Z1_ABYX5|nr:MAG: gfo/Idh/MocA family oxidoreductase [Candidatus Abyssubacteria bacterium SURF_5]
MERVKIGVIGCGQISDLTVWGYLEDERVEIAAVCDSDKEKAETKAKQWRAGKVYHDYRDLLQDKEVDAVEIITPHDLHCRMAIDAARSKKHISVQKPMACTVAECRQMTDAAQEANVLLRVNDPYVFYPPIVKARELIDAGEIGPLAMIRVRTTVGSMDCGWSVDPSAWAWRFDTRRSGGGNMLDDMHHKFATAFYLGGDVEKVSAFIENRDYFADAPATVMWKYKSGQVYGVMECVHANDMHIKTKYYNCEERFEITGSRGIIWITRCTGRLMDLPALIMYRNGETREFHGIAAEWEDGFKQSNRHFIDCLLDGVAPRLSSEEAIKVMQFALSTYASDDKQAAVNPDLVS